MPSLNKNKNKTPSQRYNPARLGYIQSNRSQP